MSTLHVGIGEQYLTIAAAYQASVAGDTILVQAGTYNNDFFTINHNITLQSVGGLANIVATASPPNGKAIITVDASATIDGFGFSGAAVSDNNGAGIRYETGDLVVRNSLFANNQDGILATPYVAGTGTILIQGSEFSHNGAGDGYSHNIYVGNVASLTIQGSYFHDAVVGHEIKSRAYSTTITGNRIQDLQGNGSYSIDLPNGGANVIQNNVIEKGVNAQNYVTVHLGGEGAPYAGSSLLMTGNTIVNDNTNGILLNNAAAAPATIANNMIWNIDAAHMTRGGPVTQGNNTTLITRPALDLATIAPAIVMAPVGPAGPDGSVGTTLRNWGVAGAVTASGHVLTVGANGQFTSLASALAASQDGDTIMVAAGTYTNDFGTVNHKVIIEGVGGIATFVQQNVPSAPAGILVVNTDATLKNLAFTGATNWGGYEAGIAVLAGNVTIENTRVYGNDVGISAGADSTTNLAIYGSEIDSNGNVARGSHNLAIGAINSLTLQGSYVHGVSTGHQVYDRAFNSLIQNNVIADGPGGTSSFLVDLGQGGAATIANNLLVKGANAANGVLVHIGGEGTPYSNSAVTVSSNTLVSQLNDPNRPYTYFVLGDANLAAPSLKVTSNTFVGGAPGSAQTINATDSGNTTAPATNIAYASPVSASLAPALFAAATGPDTVTLALSENKGDVDAQFVATLDGVVIGGGVVTAAHGTDPSQTFTFHGAWGAGQHQLGVSIINPKSNLASAYSLFVDAAAYNGNSVAPGIMVNGANPSATVTVASLANSIVLHMAEDAYLGDAQFVVSVDGAQIGGIRSVTALRSLGQTEAVTLAGAFSSAAHRVVVTFLNDAYGGPGMDRNLYVSAIDVNGVANPFAQANLYSDGSAVLSASGVAVALPNAQTLAPVSNPAPLSSPVPLSSPAPLIAPPSTPSLDTLVLYVSEDAYGGDAQFTVSLDGVQLGGIRSATASHGLGASQAVRLTGAFGAGPHALTVSFLNDAFGGPGLDRNLYIDSASFNGMANTDAHANLYSNGTAALAITGPAAAATLNSDIISIQVAEDAYLGDAQFSVSVDGKQVGGLYTATALHSQGQTQPVIITGTFGAGAHTVGVSFINDLYGGSAGLDRNLYVQSVTMDGITSATPPAALLSNGTANFAVQTAVPVAATASDTLVVHLSQDMFGGDAQFLVAIDGVSQGPAQSVSAQHSLGQVQDFTYHGSFGAGPHDIAISFINDAYGGPGLDRNLYVNGIDFNGAHAPAATAALYSNGVAHLQIGLAPAM